MQGIARIAQQRDLLAKEAAELVVRDAARGEFGLQPVPAQGKRVAFIRIIQIAGMVGDDQPVQAHRLARLARRRESATELFDIVRVRRMVVGIAVEPMPGYRAIGRAAQGKRILGQAGLQVNLHLGSLIMGRQAADEQHPQVHRSASCRAY